MLLQQDKYSSVLEACKYSRLSFKPQVAGVMGGGCNHRLALVKIIRLVKVESSLSLEAQQLISPNSDRHLIISRHDQTDRS